MQREMRWRMENAKKRGDEFIHLVCMYIFRPRPCAPFWRGIWQCLRMARAHGAPRTTNSRCRLGGMHKSRCRSGTPQCLGRIPGRIPGRSCLVYPRHPVFRAPMSVSAGRQVHRGADCVQSWPPHCARGCEHDMGRCRRPRRRSAGPRCALRAVCERTVHGLRHDRHRHAGLRRRLGGRCGTASEHDRSREQLHRLS